MTEADKPEDIARPKSGMAFLSGLRAAKLPSMTAHLIFWSIAILGTVLDLASKRVIFDWLSHRQSHSFSIIDGFLHLVMALNDGAAFGIASGQRYLLIPVSIVALVVIIAVFLFGSANRTLLWVVLGLLAAGVSGNLYDRIFNNGQVRDFIDVVYWPGRHWPAFNLADTMLCVGVGLIILSTLITGRPSRKHARQHK